MIRQGTHADRSLIGAARELRENRTEAEAAMWAMLRGRRLLGLKFRRQHQIQNFILDFYCLELKLAIELDGEPHFDPIIQARDVARTEHLQRLGITLLRFENAEVVVDQRFVFEQIQRIAVQLK